MPRFAPRPVLVALALLAAACAGPARAADPLLRNTLPAVSPDGKHIAFVSNRDSVDAIWIADVDTANVRRLTPAGFAAGLPAWTADGRAVRVCGAGADSGALFVVPLATGTPQRVARMPGRSPRLSPDGKRAVYLAGPWTRTELWVADVTGAHAVRISGDAATAWNPAWSRDGKNVAYTYIDSAHVASVHVVRSDGKDDRAVTALPREAGAAQVPAWSPDGKRIAFQAGLRSPRTSHVWVTDADGKNATRLAPHDAPYLDEAPAWFPDGKRIAFQSDRTGGMEIWIMNADGTDARQVTGLAP